MVANNAFPLVRAALADVYNNSFLASHAKHRDLLPSEVTFEWVGTTTFYPCTEQSLAAAEQLLGAQPQWAGVFNTTTPDSQIPEELKLPAYAYLESLGLY